MLAYSDKKKKKKWCALLVNPGNEKSITLGAPFFRRYYTVFFQDRSYEGSGPSSKIGFAEVDHDDEEGARPKAAGCNERRLFPFPLVWRNPFGGIWGPVLSIGPKKKKSKKTRGCCAI